MKEEELGLIITDNFKRGGWTIYSEVSKSGGGSDRADIYLVKNGESCSIEVKTTWGIKILEQTLAWRDWSSIGAYLAIPKPKYKKSKIIEQICKELKLGLIYVDYTNSSMMVKFDPVKPQKYKTPWLHEEQKASVACNNKSEFVTPFSVTRGGWYKLFETVKEVELTKLLEQPHHYASKASARASIIKLAKTGALNFIIRDNMCIWKK